MSPSPTFTNAPCVSCQGAYILNYKASWYVSSVPRYAYARKRLSWKSPLESRKWGVLGDKSPMGWGVSMRPQRHILGRNRVDWCVVWDSSTRGRLCTWHLPEKSPEKNSASRQLHPYGEQPSPCRLLWSLSHLVAPPTSSVVQIFALNGYWVFVLRGAENGQFLYLASTAHYTM
jgi:hypothetical protein